MSSSELRRAAEFLRAGNRQAARSLLMELVRRDPRTEDAWYLLSFALDDPNKKNECLNRTLRLNPNHPLAAKRLAQLSGRAVPASAPRKSGSAPPAGQTPPFRAQPPIGKAQTSSPPRRASVASGVTPVEELNLPPKPRRGLIGIVAVLGGGFLVCVLCGAAVFFAYSYINPTQTAENPGTATARAQLAAAVASEGGNQGLPASWTPTHTPTITGTPTPRPTNTATPTATLPLPNPTDQAEMQAIRLEVADLRGFAPLTEVPSYLVNTNQVRPILENMFFANGGTSKDVEEQARELIALGLIKPTYNLYDNILNSLADGLGGFFDPQTKQLFVIGDTFSGIEHFIYAHEFDHGLVDQVYNFDSLGVYPLCLHQEDYCRAVRAVVEGDASLLMDQWLNQYASPQDFLDIENYEPPIYTLPEQFPPPYAELDALFPYVFGYEFVNFLYERGNWAEVNRAYENLPQSSEQIIHPEKYLAGETPLTVPDVDLPGIMGENWRSLANDALGEWGTFLLLGYSADLESQLSDEQAVLASAGWGGDRYQVLYNDAQDLILLVGHWIWDSSADAGEFGVAVQDYLSARHRGQTLSRPNGACWQSNNQISCIFESGSETLWILSPDETSIDQVLTQYPNFP